MAAELPVLPQALEAVVKDHLETLHQAIAERAQKLALQEASGSPGVSSTPAKVTPMHCLKAISQIAPGKRVGTVLVEEPTSFWNRFANTVSPITLISFCSHHYLCRFGLWALSAKAPGAGNPAINGGAYLDIAKIFAGAIVGSPSVAAASTKTTTRSFTKDLGKRLVKRKTSNDRSPSS